MDALTWAFKTILEGLLCFTALCLLQLHASSVCTQYTNSRLYLVDASKTSPNSVAMGLSAVIFVAFFVSAEIFSVDAFCRRPYDFPDWESKTLAKRAEAVDIVVYGNVTASPCKKPPPTKAPTTALPTTSANATQGNSTQGNSTQVSSTAAPATPEIKSNSSSHSPESSDSSYNCSSAFYNVTVKVFCVIKGGHLPEILHLEKFGLGEEMCVHPNETIHQFHAYEGLNYVFFLGRYVSRICV